MAKASSHTLKLPASEEPALRAFFLEHGFEFKDLAYAFWQARTFGCVASFYKSGKLVIQGPEADTWRGLMTEATAEARPYIAALRKHPTPAPDAWIGTDEAGKGDYFGPLVVAGVCLSRDQLPLVAELGVADSKTLGDDRIRRMAREIGSALAWEVIVIKPPRYNELHPKMGNLNRMMGWAHGKAIEGLLDKGAAGEGPVADYVIVDRFADDRLMSRFYGDRTRALKTQGRVELRKRAEEDPAVAAASILARASYLKWMDFESRRLGVELRPGAGAPTLRAGRTVIERHGKGVLGDIAKLHFATTDQIGGR